MATEEAVPDKNAEACGPDFKARSANILEDLRMKELQHYTRSHQHESRLRDSAELPGRPAGADTATPKEQKEESKKKEEAAKKQLRAEGCEVMDTHMKKLSKEEAVVPHILKTGELPEAFRDRPSSKEQLQDSMETRMATLRKMDRFQTRLGWRETMDHSLRRLLVDMDLSRDERLKEYEIKNKGNMMAQVPDKAEVVEEKVVQQRFAKARCEHLTKVYSWYEIHGMKEARKERKAPPYLTYLTETAVMAGSMRVAPPLRELMKDKDRPGGAMAHSSSSPALLSAGAATVAPMPEMGA